jgi:glucosylceramidase
MACGQQCINVLEDPMNCGGCGIPCSTGQICQGGACQCTSGVVCNGACVPPDANPCGGTMGTTGSTLVTSAPGAYWQMDGQLTEVTSERADVTVNDTSTAQTWEGFGGAFNEMGWYYLSMLSESDRDKAIHLLYGADGARFAFGRIPIGASDYAMDRYTLDETPDDTSLASFSIARDQQRLIPFVKAAQAVKSNIRFWASPWTPPTWMKQGPPSKGNVVSPFDGGTMKDDDATLQVFAQYLVKFVQAYAQQGISIEAISPQNEPSYLGNYPTCGWAPATYTKLVGQYLGPAVESAGLTTKIMLGSFNGGDSDPAIISSVMGDANAPRYIKVLGFQWGMLGKVASAKSYHLPIWQSEHKCGNYPWAKQFDASTAPNDQAYAVESWGLIRDWIKAGVTAYSAWNMVLDTVGVGIDTTRVWPQNALLTVDTQAKTLIITPTYYVFRHFSQFVATGAKLAASSGGDAVAFKNPDGSIVAVMYNSGSAKTMTVATAGKKLQFAMPGNGWATVVSR